VNLYNPSLDLLTIVRRLRDVGQKAVIAVAPAVELHQHQHQHASGHTRSSSLSPDQDDPENSGKGKGKGKAGFEKWHVVAAQEFSAWLVDELGGPDR